MVMGNMFVIEVTAPNLNKWEADATRFDYDIDHVAMIQAFKRIIKLFHRWQRKAFRSGGSIQKSGAHAALSDSYREWKERNYPGRPIMVLTGKLRKSMTGGEGGMSTYGRLGREWYLKIGTTVKSGDNYDYPLAHQEGSAKGGKVRKTIDPTDREMQLWLREIQKEIIKVAKRHPTFIDSIRGLSSTPARWNKKKVP